ncbi:MAG: leucine--tRNA ligase, partial [Candidatus Neomarinimicrobiota bacterium]
KYYVLDMFPYPSGTGLHVGHPLGYIATDILARFKRMQGFNVLHPIGWDAFGLPAEQYAVQTGTHPAVTTAKNIDNFRRQIKMLGFSYDWDREINTTDPGFYKWTQWIFLQLYNKGLAYQAEVPVNWCPELGTVLANEEVIKGKSERGAHPVFRVPMKQWMLKITDYAESLLAGLEILDWPENILELQRNWIGRSEGVQIDFCVAGGNDIISVFTTRPDTLFGATYMVLSPEHPLVPKLTIPSQKTSLKKYKELASTKSDLERGELTKEKTGIFTGAYALNPATRQKIPIWVADYVLMSYGSGSIMAVPGQDQRDWDFAKKYDLPILRTVQPHKGFEGEAYTGDGPAINSDFLNGLKIEQAQEKILTWLKDRGIGKKRINYKLRDWLFSRQRYWGEPFPLIHTKEGIMPLDEGDLPLKLPQVEKYEPTGTGDSPLKNIKEWVEVKDERGQLIGLRETNTMPQWAGSCWYYMRYLDPHNDDKFVDPELEKYWMPVDLYIGGAEHAVLHLLYARFWHHVLFDLGFVSSREPFKKLFNQGMILGSDGLKMSKSRGNTVNPDDTVVKYGADAMRLYEMFMGPLDKAKPWKTEGLKGCFRFLKKLWAAITDGDGLSSNITDDEPNKETLNLLHKTIYNVTEDLNRLQFNTAVSEFMIFTNHLLTLDYINVDVLRTFVKLINPFIPHFAEEINSRLGIKDDLSFQSWPEYDKNLALDKKITIAVQINGKRRGQLIVDAKEKKENILIKALKVE